MGRECCLRFSVLFLCSDTLQFLGILVLYLRSVPVLQLCINTRNSNWGGTETARLNISISKMHKMLVLPDLCSNSKTKAIFSLANHVLKGTAK